MAKRLTDEQVRFAIIEYLSETKRYKYFSNETIRYHSVSAAEIARAVHVSKKRAEEILNRLNEEYLVYVRLGRRYVMKYKWANQKEIDRMQAQREFSDRFTMLRLIAENAGLSVGHSGEISMSLDTFEMLLNSYEKSL